MRSSSAEMKGITLGRFVRAAHLSLGQAAPYMTMYESLPHLSEGVLTILEAEGWEVAQHPHGHSVHAMLASESHLLQFALHDIPPMNDRWFASIHLFRPWPLDWSVSRKEFWLRAVYDRANQLPSPEDLPGQLLWKLSIETRILTQPPTHKLLDPNLSPEAKVLGRFLKTIGPDCVLKQTEYPPHIRKFDMCPGTFLLGTLGIGGSLLGT